MDGGVDARRITIHKPEDFAGMRVPGRLCHDFIVANGAVPAPLNYRGFPKSICTSINHVVCHGIPGDRRLEDGDVLNIDVTVILDGWHGDSSRMYAAGPPSAQPRNHGAAPF